MDRVVAETVVIETDRCCIIHGLLTQKLTAHVLYRCQFGDANTCSLAGWAIMTGNYFSVSIEGGQFVCLN